MSIALKIAFMFNGIQAETVPPAIDLLADSHVFEDRSGQLKINDVVRFFAEGGMEEFRQQKKLSYSFTESSIWVRVEVSNPSDQEEIRYIGSIRPELATFNLYLVNGGIVKQKWLGGVGTDTQMRQVPSRLNFFKVNLPANSQQIYYFEIKARLSLSLVLQYLTPDQYLSHYQVADATHFFYFGTMFSLIIYSMFFYFSLRDRNFLIYCLFGAGITLSDFVYSGFLEYWDISILFIDSHDDALPLLAGSASLSLVYVLSFFNIKDVSVRLFRFGVILIGLSLLVMIAGIFARTPLIAQLCQLTQFVSMVFSLAVGSYIWGRGNRSAGFYVIGWGIFASFILVWFMGNIGIITKSYFVAFGPLYGNVVEMILTAIALSFQFNDMKDAQFQKDFATAESESLRTLVQVVCHDIANPLCVIAGSARIASRSDDLTKHFKAWERVNRASHSIESIIEQVKRMQALKVGKNSLELKKVLVADAFKEVLFLLNEKATAKDLRLIWECDETFEVLADHTSLVHDVLCNFISNPLSFLKEVRQFT